MQQLEHSATSAAVPVIAFSVAGTPQTQGSKVVAGYTGTRVKFRGISAIVSPRAVLVEQSNMQSKKYRANRLKRWRGKIEAAARAAMNGKPFLDEAVELQCDFIFVRPPSHYTSKGEVTKGARSKVPTGDLSKLVRAVEDALTKIVYRDDTLVVHYSSNTRKRFSAHADGRAGVFIEVKPCPPS